MSDNVFHRLIVSASLLAVLTVCSHPAAAQDVGGPGGGRIYQEQLRVELDKQQAAGRQIGLDGGGWYTFALFNYDDASARTERTLRQHELRLWGQYTEAGVHTFYVRGTVGYDDWNSGSNPDIWNKSADDFREPRVERAWYVFDYNRLIRNRTGQDPAMGLVAKVGRDYYTIGTALTLGIPLDAVQVTTHWKNWQVMGLFGMTLHDTPNIDDSAAVSDHMDRHFFGTEVRYKGFSRHEPFAYVLLQRDHTGADFKTIEPWQAYHYDSNYVGFGSTGSVLDPNLRYSTELVFECGRSFAEGVSDQTENIDAMAFDLLLEYLFRCKTRPKASFEYLFGSGDRNRRASATSSVGGNMSGTPDRAFNAFGFRDTGLAFGPDPANLHILSGGASCFPLEDCNKWFEKMEVGTKVFFYMKDRGSGAISDTTAVNQSTWVGWEWDLFCNWRVTSDVSWTVRYGIFAPGEAFGGAKDSRHFFYTGFTYSF